MSTIGNIVIGLSASTSALSKGLGSAKSSLKSFGSVLSSTKAGFLGLAGAIGVGLSIGGIKSLISGSIEAVSAQNDLANSLGTSVSKLSALQFALDQTGSSSAALGPALQKMSANLGKAITEGGAAEEAFTKLGLSAQTLASQDPSVAFKSIADAISTLPTSAQQSAAAMEVFGKGGISVLNTLKAGSGEISKLEKQAGQLGITLSAFDASQIDKLGDKFSTVKQIFGGLSNQVTAQLTPFLEVAVDRLMAFIQESGGLKSIVSKGLEFVASGVGIVADVFHGLHIVFKVVQAGITGGLALLVQGIGLLAKAVQELLNLLPGVETSFGDTIQAIGSDLTDLAGKQFEEAKNLADQPLPSDKIKASFDSIVAANEKARSKFKETKKSIEGIGTAFSQASQDGAKLIDSLKQQIATFGMATGAAEIYKLIQSGAPPQQIEEARKLFAELEELQKKQDLKDFAKGLSESTRTESEKAFAELEKIQEALADPASGIDPEAASRRMKELQAQLAEGKAGAAAAADPRRGTAQTLVAGGLEARNAVLANMNRGRFGGAAKDNENKQIAKNTAQQAAQQAQTNALLAKLLAETQGGFTF